MTTSQPSAERDALANAERIAQARKVVGLLERRHFDPQLGMERVEIAHDLEPKVVPKIFGLCGQEIFEAIAPDETGRVFCNLRLIPDISTGKFRLAGNLSIVVAGVSRAVRAALKHKDRSVGELVRSEVASELAQRRDERIAVFRKLPAREILPRLLVGLRNGLHENMTVHIDHLTGVQRSDLAALLFDQLTDDLAIYIPMDRIPEEPTRWLLWYIYHSDFATPEKKDKLGGIPKHLIATRRGAIPQNKRGGFVMPLGPMYAKVFEKQKRDMNRLGMLPKNPGVKKIAEGLDVDHSAVSRWLKEDLPLTLESDGKGGVYYNFNLKTINRCIELVRGGKRGPKPKSR